MMQEVWIADDGVRLYAVEGGDGPAVVFLHGGLADHRAVLPLVGSLTDRYRVVAPDLRASGRSWDSRALSFDRLTTDLLRLFDHLELKTAFLGGVSTGTGPVVHFALHHPERVRGLIMVTPVYAGDEIGYSTGQAAAFRGMDAVAGRAGAEGIEVLKPMYFSRLPDDLARRAWEMASGFDPSSVATTSHFIASGAQPFNSAEDLRAIQVPTLLVKGDDPVHPSEVSDLYLASIVDCTALAPGDQELSQAIRNFCDQAIAV